jgi:NAD(P)-dependent dehydrogenase (short-subunit alcohol dehydrogenase family)
LATDCLLGQTAVVTGGARGIGAAIVRELARLQARVIIVDLNYQAARELAEAVGGVAYAADATNPAALQNVFARIDQSEQGVDILVNNVGGGARRTLEQMSLEDWEQTCALNLTSAWVASKGVLDAMKRRGGGRIINVASIAAHSISPVGGGAYAASKAGLLALTRQTAHEWARYGIRANAVCPGPTRTDLTHASVRKDSDFPLGAWIAPEDIAAAVCFLASPAAAMCTGAVLDVDGGVRLG